MASTSSSTSSMITPSSSGNLLRITGMASGLDVDTTVTKMMSPQQTKIDKANQDKQIIQWKQTAYQDIITDLKDLQNSFFDVTSKDTNILSSANYAAFNITSSDDSLSTIGAATPGVGATIGNYSMKVTQIAAGAAFTPTLSGTTDILLTSKLTDITSGAGAINTLSATDSMNVNLNLVLKVNEGQSTSQTLNISLDNSSGIKTVSDLVSAINNKGNGTVKASYSEVTKKLTLTTVGTGSTKTIKIDASSSTALKQLFDNSVGTQKTGVDAKINIKAPGENAFSSEITQTSNNFTLDGINYNLTGTTAVGVAVNFNVAQDTQKVYDKIKGFIDKYNKLVEKIYTKLNEKTNKDYKPLTDAQKESMTTDQINAWNTKAQAGLLRNDNNLSTMLKNLESAFNTRVSGVGLSIGEYGSGAIGIDTSDGTSKIGQIRITDAVKLKNAIASNSDQILNLFTATSSTTITSSSTQQQKTDYFNQSGIFQRVKDILESNVGRTGTSLNSATLTKYANYQDNFSLFGGAGLNTLPDQLYAKNNEIKDLQKKYSKLQTKYYNQFSRLESVMSQLGAQSNSLTAMLGG